MNIRNWMEAQQSVSIFFVPLYYYDILLGNYIGFDPIHFLLHRVANFNAKRHLIGLIFPPSGSLPTCQWVLYYTHGAELMRY